MSWLRWAEDFQSCVQGEHGQEWSERADEWIQEHADDASDQAWASWRELRQAAGAA